jgi:hypothetical protein
MSENGTSDNRLLIIAIVAIVVLILCCCLIVAGLVISNLVTLPWDVVGDARVQATESFEEAFFDVSTPLLLAVDVNVGDVTIEVGDDDEVSVSGTKRAWGRDDQQAEEYLDDFEIRIRQMAADEIKIETDMPGRLSRASRSPSVDLEITVPRETDLDLVVNVGEVEVTGVQGAFDVRANVGDVILRDVRFEEDSRLKNDVGSIELYLPSDSSFAFSAEANVGDIRIDFPVQNERSERRVVGGSVEGEIGRSPTVEVDLTTNTGNIAIREAD